MPLQTLLCETDQVIAIEQDLGGECVVVTFNPVWQFRDGLHFWGDNLLLTQRISAVGIVSLGPNWYPRRAMEQIVVAVRDRTKGRKVVTLGQSQGGYGALKFASQLNAIATLAFGPQWSINPAEVGSFDTRFIRYFDPSLNNGLRIEQTDLCNCSYIFFDALESVDAGHVAQLSALGGVKAVITPFAVNETIQIVTEGLGTARLISLVTSALPPTTIDLRQVIRASRKHSLNYLDKTLRQLIFRMSRSRSRSSVFVSDLLCKIKEPNPFYGALVAHAKGDVTLAYSELTKATVNAFDNVDLLSWLHLSHKLQFANAELAVAVQILERYPRDTGACLQALNSLIAAGDLERARRELARIATHGDASDRVDWFVEFSVKLRNPSILETLLSNGIAKAARVRILFALVDLYQRVGDRPNAFRRLKDLAMACVDSPADLRRVSEYCVNLHEVAFALEILERLLRSARHDHLLALEVVKARIPVNKGQALSELNAVLSVPGLPSACWERASHLYDALGDADLALRSIRKAVDTPGSGTGARHRLAALLAQKGRTRRARHELAILLEEGGADSGQLRASGDLAFNLKDRHLAQRFAEAQFGRAPNDPASILYLARHCRLVGDQIRAERLLSSLFFNERRSPSMSDQHWIKLAEELYEAGNVTLTKEAIAKVVTREPTDATLCKLIATIAVLERIGIG